MESKEKKFFTRKRMVIPCIAAGVILIAVPALWFLNFLNNTRDYKNVLAVREKTSPAAAEEVYRQAEAVVIQSPVSTSPPDQSEQDGQMLIQSLPPNLPARKGNVINVLFLGIDRTEERDTTIGAHRTDSIVLASIDMEGKKVEVLSIPRDSYVYIPCIGKKDKINHAYVWGGMGEKGISSTIETVNKFLKYSAIDYYFAIDMEPVPKIVDELGGVELDVEVDMKTNGYNLSKGRQLLDGAKAMQYIRWRYSGMGDIDRVKRQQKFAKTMFNKLKESNQLLKSVGIVMNYNKNVKTNMSLQQMIALARMAMDIPQGSTNFHDIKGRSRYVDNIWYWVPEDASTDATLKKVFHVEGQ